MPDQLALFDAAQYEASAMMNLRAAEAFDGSPSPVDMHRAANERRAARHMFMLAARGTQQPHDRP